MTKRLLPAALALVLLLIPAAAAGAKGKPSKISSASVVLKGEAVSVKGKVRLRTNTRAIRKRTRVRVVLDGTGKTETHRLGISSKRRFRRTFTTKLRGPVTVSLRLLIKGKAKGKRVRRGVTIGATAPSGPLVGTFKLTGGDAKNGRAPTGTWFQMLYPGGAPLSNGSSPAENNDYTPLQPGTDGGLKTTGFQPAPNPAFSGGNARANRIVQPAPFFGPLFSIITAPLDAQTGQTDPAPVVRQEKGKLSGQVTAWVAQWNNQSFNQGSPKPDGSTPAPTTPLSGTYDAESRKFELRWKSLIQGGPFNGFTGSWHLEGTFVPAGS